MPVTYYKIPQTPEDATPELVENLKRIGLFPGALVNWNTGTDWFNAHFYGPLVEVPSDPSKSQKTWDIRENNLQPFYFRFAKSPDGTWAKWYVVASGKPTSGQNPPETFRQPDATNPTAPVNMNVILGQDFQNLMAEYGPKVVAIPQLEAVYFTPEEIHAQNYSTGFTQLPINPTWPRQFIPVFDPQGNPAIVKISDFIANTPKPSTSGGSLTESQIGAAIRRNVALLDDAALGKLAKALVLN